MALLVLLIQLSLSLNCRSPLMHHVQFTDVRLTYIGYFELTDTVDPLFAPFLGCESGLISFNPKATIPCYIAIIAFDTIIFSLTFYRALRTSTFFITLLSRKVRGELNAVPL